MSAFTLWTKDIKLRYEKTSPAVQYIYHQCFRDKTNPTKQWGMGTLAIKWPSEIPYSFYYPNQSEYEDDEYDDDDDDEEDDDGPLF